MTAAVSGHTKDFPHGLRLAKPDDVAYLVDTWVKTHPDRRERRKRELTKEVRERMMAETVLLRVAHDPADEDAIWAWCCVDVTPPVPAVVWCYTRSGLWRRGLQRSLLRDLEGRRVEVSHDPRFPLPDGWSLNVNR